MINPCICFALRYNDPTSTSSVLFYIHRNETITFVRDGEHRTSTLTFTQPLNSDVPLVNDNVELNVLGSRLTY